MKGNMPEKALEEALEFLSSFTDYEQKAADQLGRRSLDLSRMRSLAAELGDPQDRIGRIFHVAGSKGKGSITLTLDQLLSGQGLKTGRFLSPHLKTVTERIAIGGQDLRPEEFAALVDLLRPMVARREIEDLAGLPSFFEAITLMAFLAWQRAGCQAVALEVGLGGRLDATNIVTPSVSILSIIDLEHTRVLGDTIAEIAHEKAGILKAGRPAVSASARKSEAGIAIEKRARELGLALYVLGEDILIKDRGRVGSYRHFDFSFQGVDYLDLRAPVLGRHQIDNIALTLAALVLFGQEEQISLDETALRRDLEGLQLPARQQFLARSEHRFPVDILLDTAHTPQSVASLAMTLDDCFPNCRKALFVGMLRDKKASLCLEELRGRFDRVFITKPNSPRAMELDELEPAAAVCGRMGVAPQRVAGQIEGLDLGDLDLLVVTGSVYLAGTLAIELSLRGRQDRPGMD